MSESETKPVTWPTCLSAAELDKFIADMEAGHKAKMKYLKAFLKAQMVMEGKEPDSE